MRGIQKFAIPIISLSLVAGCAPKPKQKSVRLVPPQPQVEGKLQRKTTNLGPRKLISEWDHGFCAFENNILSYNGPNAHKKIKLDVKVEGAKTLICSDDYTVILTPDKAVVALGAYPVLSGSEMLGQLSGRFVPANSYYLGIEDISSEKIVYNSVNGAELTIKTKAGNKWTLDLADPVKWNIY